MKKTYTFAKTIGDNDMVDIINAHRDLVAKIQKLENDAVDSLIGNHLRRPLMAEDLKDIGILYFPVYDKTIITYKGEQLYTLTRVWDKCKYSINIETL